MTNIFTDFLSSLSLLNLGLAFSGVLAGIIIGALPGLSATMAVAILVPFTFALEPSSGLIVLGAIYTGAIFGGSWSAILINTPGTPSAVATTFDGYPMAKSGNGDLAMSISCMSSFVGGIVGVICLALFAPPLASISLKFGPTEYFWLAILGLTLISTLAEGDNIKSLIGACLGLLMSMIGVAVIGGDMRMTWNISFLNSGIEIVSAMIGLFCIPVILDLTSMKGKHLSENTTPKSLRLKESFLIMYRKKFEALRGAIIGTFIGILPGAGGSIASIVSYGEAKRSSKNKNKLYEDKINSIFKDLVEKTKTFEELAIQFSEDRKSAKNGGEIGWINSGGNFYPEFEEAVFSLNKDGEYSKPFKTPNGWHIVKRLSYEPIGDLKSMSYFLKNKIQKKFKIKQQQITSKRLRDRYHI